VLQDDRQDLAIEPRDNVVDRLRIIEEREERIEQVELPPGDRPWNQGAARPKHVAQFGVGDDENHNQILRQLRLAESAPVSMELKRSALGERADVGLKGPAEVRRVVHEEPEGQNGGADFERRTVGAIVGQP
jgi:hypothetical protein